HFFEEIKKGNKSLVPVVEKSKKHKKEKHTFTIFLSTQLGPKKFYFETNQNGKIDFNSIKIFSKNKFTKPKQENIKDFYFGMRKLIKTWKH
ncbi:MAG: hypothetical protein QXS90_03325, partial [Candidatus Diapherotrites archaeon]